MSKTKLYISGPIKNTPNHRQNFDTAVHLLLGSGYEPVSPLEVSGCKDNSCLERDKDPYHSDGKHTWECYLKYDLIAMLECDGVAMLDNWYNSKGALLEFSTARAVGMPIKNLRNWLDDAVTSS